MADQGQLVRGEKQTQIEDAPYTVLLKEGGAAPAVTGRTSLTLAPAPRSDKGDIDWDGLRKAVEKLVSDIIAIWHGQNQDRGEATRLIVDHFLHAFPGFNVMVVYPPHLHTFKEFVKVGVDVPVLWVGHVHYDVYVMKEGHFTLIGDGGYINWAFGGNFIRTGAKVVDFFPY